MNTGGGGLGGGGAWRRSDVACAATSTSVAVLAAKMACEMVDVVVRRSGAEAPSNGGPTESTTSSERRTVVLDVLVVLVLIAEYSCCVLELEAPEAISSSLSCVWFASSSSSFCTISGIELDEGVLSFWPLEKNPGSLGPPWKKEGASFAFSRTFSFTDSLWEKKPDLLIEDDEDDDADEAEVASLSSEPSLLPAESAGFPVNKDDTFLASFPGPFLSFFSFSSSSLIRSWSMTEIGVHLDSVGSSGTRERKLRSSLEGTWLGLPVDIGKKRLVWFSVLNGELYTSSDLSIFLENLWTPQIMRSARTGTK